VWLTSASHKDCVATSLEFVVGVVCVEPNVDDDNEANNNDDDDIGVGRNEGGGMLTNKDENSALRLFVLSKIFQDTMKISLIRSKISPS
jgi:hypothetical protein